MEVKDFFHILKRRPGVVIYFWLVFIILAAGLTFSQPLKYEAKSRLLIVQDVTGVDPYTVSKSNQYLSSLFSQVAYSNSFFNLVVGSDKFDIDENYFSSDYKKQMKTWQKTISAQSTDTGIISISIYHPNTYQARQLALGVNDALMNQGFNYQSGGEGVTVKIIDQPLISDYPVKPNIIFNFLAFSFLGIMAGLVYLYFFPHKRAKKKVIREIEKVTEPIKNEIRYEREPALSAAPAFSHPAEKVMVGEEESEKVIQQIKTENNEETERQPIQGNIKNLININRL